MFFLVLLGFKIFLLLFLLPLFFSYSLFFAKDDALTFYVYCLSFGCAIFLLFLLLLPFIFPYFSCCLFCNSSLLLLFLLFPSVSGVRYKDFLAFAIIKKVAHLLRNELLFLLILCLHCLFYGLFFFFR